MLNQNVQTLTSAEDPASPQELEQAMSAFSEISENLLAGYEALTGRAERVEAELCRTNAELASKVAELDAVKRHLEAILESLPTGVVVRDAKGLIVRMNDAALALLGVTADEALGHANIDGLPAEPSTSDADPEDTYEFQRPDGEQRILSSRFSKVVARDEGPAGSVEIIDDRTALTQMRERIHQLDKMAAMGTMAAGIAHEIRNPMNGIKGFAHLLLRDAPTDSVQARWSQLICDGVNEADGIITSMLTFAEPERLRPEEIEIGSIVEEALSANRRMLEMNTNAERWTLDADYPDLRLIVDSIKIRQAVRNLVANAIDAQPDGGAVRVIVTHDETDVTIHVHDAGPGISPDIANKITEPFFTTRPEGTGLGLALVHTIVRLHGGSIEVSPSPSLFGGAHMFLRIPRNSEACILPAA
ncbi:MAG: PAS domain S-box-containing protein [Planctomycetota bacterium]|jgi:PAS domain S-box-containing protein